MGSITLTVEEWQDLIRKREEAEDRAAQLATELAEQKMQTGDPLTPILIDGILAAWNLVSFLIAHAHPEIVKTQPWPWAALVVFADVLEQLPAPPPEELQHHEAALDMRDMAKEAQRWNTVRAERKERLAAGEAVSEPSDSS